MKKALFVIIIMLNFNALATEYYVSTNGNNQNDGLTESTAWRTITYAATKAKSEDIVWIKSGNYGNENVVVKNKGEENKPISFIGYKNTPGDITSLYYSYAKSKPLDSNEMPMLDGGNRASGLKGISLNKSKYIVIKNIQITNYRWGIHGGNTSNSTIERILAISFGDIRSTAASGYGAQFGRGGNNIVKECVFINATGANFRIEGDNNIIDNVKSYADDNSTGNISATDYYIHINGGHNNIIRNCYVERVGDLEHTGHGIGLKYDCENNLIENCEIVNIKGSIEFRHSGVKNNIARNILITGSLGAITFRDGASNNIVENSIVKDSNEGIRFYDQTEDGQGGIIASNNIVKNTIFNNIGDLIAAKKSKKVSKTGFVSGNKVINCTIINVNNIFDGDLPMDSTNEILNSIFIGVKNYENKKSKYSSAWKNLNNNYFNNGFSPVEGNGNISEDPKFEDVEAANFRLKSTSKLIDAGKRIDNVKKDFDGNSRPQGQSHDIGAFEYNDGSTGSIIHANAGNDVSICSGESVKLSASGGSTYQWSTGETTASIVVNPTSTESYSVIVSEGSNSDTDDVLVTVNNITANAGSDITIEEGESVKLSASGGSTYQWSTGETTTSIIVTPSSTQNYTVTVSKNGCEDTDSVQVKVEAKITNPPPAEAFAGDDISICLGEGVTLNGSGGTSYQWNTGDTTKNIQVNPTRTTTYTLSATRGGVTNSDTITITVENCKISSLSEDDINKSFTVYPNPTRGILNVSVNNSDNEELNLVLMNLNGNVVYTNKMNSDHQAKEIDLSRLAKGIYFIRLFNSNQNMIKKILVI